MRYTVGVSRFEDGTLAEIFLNTAKQGTAIDVNARDAAVAASPLFQHGCSVDTLRQALTCNSDGSASGPLARALDLIADWR
jgi:ribonucleoside-diphosphate reductase alpha chain